MAKRTAANKESKEYIKEMSIWLNQQRCRLKNCEISVKECEHSTANIVKLRNLEKAQMAIIRKSIIRGEKQLAAYKKSQG